ncbi:MAG: hydroxyacid dehydrogenase [Clostridia bacterium]|nr:hydroxyacid dehydrogenase [Clostridia bacterium]
MNITVLDAATLGGDLDLSVLEMNGRHELTVCDSTPADEVGARVRSADVVILNKIKLGEHNLPPVGEGNTKLICVTATGFDNIDLDACRRRGIGVCNVVGYSSDSVAQMTVAIVLNLVNHLDEYTAFVRSGEYSASGCANRLTPVFHELRGKTWGILGLGRIGKQTARIAEAFGCRVIACKRTPDEDYTCVDMETLFRESDILTVHVPLSNATRGIVNAELLSLMKRDAVLVNMARGAVTDEAAVARAVLDGRIGAFGADVYSVEPFGAEHPFTALLGLKNVCLTPHASWGAYEARERCILEIVENINAFERGEKRCRVDL